MEVREYFNQKEYKTIGGFVRAVKSAVRKFFFGCDDILSTRIDSSMGRDESFTVVLNNKGKSLLPATIEEILRKSGFISFGESIRESGKIVWKQGIEFDFENGIIYLYEHYEK